jgi:hypothetical protein
MKNLSGLILAICLCTLPRQATTAEEIPAGIPARFMVGISPYLENSVKDDVYRRIIAMLIEDLPLNSSLAIYDAYHLRTIAEAEIPDARAFQSAKTRANHFGESIRALKQFLAAPHAPPWPEGKMSFNGAIRLPQFMDFVAEHPNDTNRKTVVIVLGSPLYIDHKEPAFSMVDGYFPSDGHLLASRDKTVFGLKERQGNLKGVAIYLGYFDDPWVSALHEEKVERFWSLFLQGEGARLAAFSGDLPTVFKAARLGQDSLGTTGRYALDRGQTKVEMLRITRDVAIADWIMRENIPNAAVNPPTTANGPMKIGIRWKGNIDLDLYARPRPGAERLYFEKARSAEGYYFKDHRSSPEREYEFIEFERPVNISEVETEINFYEGKAPGGAEGEIRVEFGGRIYSGRFRIPADHGNEGREGSRQNSFWSVVDVASILGANEDVHARAP